MNAPVGGTQVGAFERFAARVARLTPEERTALARAHRRPVDTDSLREWHAYLRDALEFGLRGFDELNAAYDVATPFVGSPLEHVILDVGLALACPPSDPLIVETLLSGWREVIGLDGAAHGLQIETWRGA